MGIFNNKSTLFTRYRATLQLRDKIMGGVPRDPKIIEGWLRSKAGLEDAEEIRQLMYRTLEELGATVGPEMTYEELVEASNKVAGARETTGFKRDADGLYIESRQVKAMLKESVNILFAGDRWGATKKGPRSFVAERVFVGPDHISLGVSEPSGIETIIGHVVGPQGPRNTLGYHEYVEQPTLTFYVMAAHDCVKEEHWWDIWNHAQENGIGALRSQGYGRFDLIAWDREDAGQQRKAA